MGGMTQTEQLIASLTATAEAGYYLDDGRYIDWSTPTAEGIVFEAGQPDGTAVQLDMTRNELLGLQQALTAYLLATK